MITELMGSLKFFFRAAWWCIQNSSLAYLLTNEEFSPLLIPRFKRLFDPDPFLIWRPALGSATCLTAFEVVAF